MDVDLDEKAVDQLWSEVKGVMEVALAWMKPFLKLFGVEEGNGLSPFAVGIDSPSDLVAMIEQFFRRPKADPRGKGTVIGDVDDDEDPDAEENNADDKGIVARRGAGDKGDRDAIEWSKDEVSMLR